MSVYDKEADKYLNHRKNLEAKKKRIKKEQEEFLKRQKQLQDRVNYEERMKLERQKLRAALERNMREQQK